MSRILLPLLLLMTSCAGPDAMKAQPLSAASQAVPLCEVLAHPRQYLGREIDVEGLYGVTPHQRILYDPSCENAELSVEIAGNNKNIRIDLRLYKLSRPKTGHDVTVSYRGIFESDPVIAGCSDDYCFRYTIRHARLLGYSVRTVKR